MCQHANPRLSNELKNNTMSYYFNKVLKDIGFEEAIKIVEAELKKEGFGILTEINIQETLKKKIDVDFKKYKILGACNPHFAHKALKSEDKIGLFLPCNVVVEENEDGNVEVSIVDPIASMSPVENKELGGLASEVQLKLMNVINNIN